MKKMKYSEWQSSVEKTQKMLDAQSDCIKKLIKNNAPDKVINYAKKIYNYYSNLKAKQYKQKYTT